MDVESPYIFAVGEATRVPLWAAAGRMHVPTMSGFF